MDLCPAHRRNRNVGGERMAVSELSLRIRVGLEDFELNADLALPGKGVSVIFGPSGSGKTTLLRAIAGLQISEGEIWFNGDCWQGSGEHRKTSERPLAYVFQEASLFPHMTVAANFDFAERYALHADTPSLRDDLITLFDIRHTLSRKPDRLSGGERQRAAIVRALLRQPDILLMDEPLASLDDARKQEILPYLERLKSEFELPIIYVTHSAYEAARLGDYIVALDNGNIVSQGTLYDVIGDPEFPGDISREAGTVVTGTVDSIDDQWHLAQIRTGSSTHINVPANNLTPGDSVRLWIRASDISLSHQPLTDNSISNSLLCQIEDVRHDPNPALTIVKLRTESMELITRITRQSASQLELEPKMQLYAHIKTAALI